jgi:hypothetical protein
MLKEKRSHCFAGFLSILLAGLFVGGVLPAGGQLLQQTPVASRITAPVDDTVRVTIARSTHPKAQARFDRGPVEVSAPMERMIMVLGVSADQEHQLRSFLDSQQTKGSPDYHHWLTPQEFGQKFGPSPQDVQQVTAWLQKQGFSVGSIARSGRWVQFSGTAAQVNQAFHTQMRTFEVEGQLHTANNTDISIPAALTPVVQGVATLHNFVKKPMHTKGGLVTLRPDATLHDGQGNVIHALAPGDFASIYNLTGLTAGINGTGQTIAIVARSDIQASDITAFQTQFGLSNTINQINDGPDPGLVPGDQDEATLDAEWSSAVASGATVDVVIDGITATTDGVDLSASFIIDNNLASVMSASFSQCEVALGATENAFLTALWEQAAAQGISVFVSSGDDGAAGCDDPNGTLATGGANVSGLASTPFNTAVGGTEFSETTGGNTDATFWNTTNATGLVSVKGYIPEMVWNESCSVASCGATNANLFSGSGGVSIIHGTPSWQAATGIPGLNFTMRALPDVSLSAAGHDGYIVCLNNSCPNSFFIFAGTSASSPSFAGIMAIIDQKTGHRQGLANYVLYSLAKAENFNNCNSSSRTNPATPSGCVFNDVTTGNNSVPGLTGFNAGTGYDLGTGLGSVNVASLVNAFAAQVTGFQGTTVSLAANPAANPITTQHGSSLNFNVGVTRAGGTATPSGTISLVASGGTLTGQVGVAATTISGTGATANGTFTGISNLPGGATYNLIASYPGDNNFNGNTSAALVLTVTAENSSTSLSSFVGFTNTGNPIPGTAINYGGFLDLRAVVASAANASPPDSFPSGTVTINDNGTPLGSIKLNSGAQGELINCQTPAPSSTVCLTVGSHPITVAYGGDAGFNGSGSSTVTITVGKGSASGTVSAPANANFGQQITVSATVNALGPVLPTGTVQFFDGPTSLGSPVTLTPGTTSSTAAQTVKLPGSGSQSITAQYSGDSTYNAATFGPGVVIVNQPFNFSFVSNMQTIAAGGTATFNITLNGLGGFAGAVNFSCTGATGGAMCTVAPNPANLTASTTSIPVTVTVSNTANARLAPGPFKTLPWAFAAAFAGLLWGVRRRPRQALLMMLALALMVGVGSCGGGGSHTPPPPTIDTLTVTGTSGTATNFTTLTLTITH